MVLHVLAMQVPPSVAFRALYSLSDSTPDGANDDKKVMMKVPIPMPPSP